MPLGFVLTEQHLLIKLKPLLIQEYLLHMGRGMGLGERKMGAGWKPAPAGLINSAHTIVLGPDYQTAATGKRQDSLPGLSAKGNVPAQPWDQHS